MIHSARFTAVLDACVLYPAPIRDLLLHLANFELYTRNGLIVYTMNGYEI